VASKSLLVAQREFLENVRTKTFWLGILAMPLLLVVSIGAGWVLERMKEKKTYTVLDLSVEELGPRIERTARQPDMESLTRVLSRPGLGGKLAELQRELAVEPTTDGKPLDPKSVTPEMAEKASKWFQSLSASDVAAMTELASQQAAAARYVYQPLDELGLDGVPREQLRDRLNELVAKGTLFAYFVVPEDPVKSLEGAAYVSNNVTDPDLRNWYAEAATRVVQQRRIAEADIDVRTARSLQERVAFREQRIGEDGRTSDVTIGEKANKYAPVAFVYLLWIAVFTAAQMLLTNTVEEKSNRIIEVLLSSVSPLQLMSGKIWGIAATGLTIVGSWVLCALASVVITPKVIGGFDFPLMEVIGDPLYLASFVGYFLGGYLLYAAILVGIGSVCNSLKEAQNLLQPVFLLLIVPLLAMMFIVQEPNGTLARVLTYVPFFTPFVMMNRAGGPPPAWEYVVSGLLLAVTVWFAFRAAGKVFRVGVLMTGNPPKLKEILGWLRSD